MKYRKHVQKIRFNDWIKAKNNDAKTILAIHIITIVGIFLLAFILQPYN